MYCTYLNVWTCSDAISARIEIFCNVRRKGKMGEEYSVISASANENARSAYTFSFTGSELALRRSSQYISVLNCSVWRSFRRFSGSILSGNVFCKSVKMNLCVATDVAEFKHSRGKLLSIYFVLSESLPYFTDGDFSILHFFLPPSSLSLHPCFCSKLILCLKVA